MNNWYLKTSQFYGRQLDIFYDSENKNVFSLSRNSQEDLSSIESLMYKEIAAIRDYVTLFPEEDVFKNPYDFSAGDPDFDSDLDFYKQTEINSYYNEIDYSMAENLIDDIGFAEDSLFELDERYQSQLELLRNNIIDLFYSMFNSFIENVDYAKQYFSTTNQYESEESFNLFHEELKTEFNSSSIREYIEDSGIKEYKARLWRYFLFCGELSGEDVEGDFDDVVDVNYLNDNRKTIGEYYTGRGFDEENKDSFEKLCRKYYRSIPNFPDLFDFDPKNLLDVVPEEIVKEAIADRYQSRHSEYAEESVYEHIKEVQLECFEGIKSEYGIDNSNKENYLDRSKPLSFLGLEFFFEGAQTPADFVKIYDKFTGNSFIEFKSEDLRDHLDGIRVLWSRYIMNLCFTHTDYIKQEFGQDLENAYGGKRDLFGIIKSESENYLKEREEFKVSRNTALQGKIQIKSEISSLESSIHDLEQKVKEHEDLVKLNPNIEKVLDEEYIAENNHYRKYIGEFAPNFERDPNITPGIMSLREFNIANSEIQSYKSQLFIKTNELDKATFDLQTIESETPPALNFRESVVLNQIKDEYYKNNINNPDPDANFPQMCYRFNLKVSRKEKETWMMKNGIPEFEKYANENGADVNEIYYNLANQKSGRENAINEGKNVVIFWLNGRIFESGSNIHSSIQLFFDPSIMGQPFLGKFLMEQLYNEPSSILSDIVLRERKTLIEAGKLIPNNKTVPADQQYSLGKQNYIIADRKKDIYQHSESKSVVLGEGEELSANKLFEIELAKCGYKKPMIDKFLTKLKICRQSFLPKFKKQYNGFIFEIPAKTNPTNIVVGNLTNCCFKVDGHAESSLIDAFNNPYSGFLLILDEKRGTLVAQSWLRISKPDNDGLFDLYLDNIEIASSRSFDSNLKDGILKFTKDIKELKGYKNVFLGKSYSNLKFDNLKEIGKVPGRTFSTESKGVYTDLDEGAWIMAKKNWFKKTSSYGLPDYAYSKDYVVTRAKNDKGWILRTSYKGEDITHFAYDTTISNPSEWGREVNKFYTKLEERKKEIDNRINYERKKNVKLPEERVQTELDFGIQDPYSWEKENFGKRRASLEIKFDPVNGIGSVPNNQSVDYLGFVKEMTPDEFLSLASKNNSSPEDKEKFFNYIGEQIKSGRGIGNPFLIVKFLPDTKEFQVIGHEGRHRAEFLKLFAPSTVIPVHVFLSGEMRRRSLDKILEELKVDLDSINFLPQNTKTASKLLKEASITIRELDDKFWSIVSDILDEKYGDVYSAENIKNIVIDKIKKEIEEYIEIDKRNESIGNKYEIEDFDIEVLDLSSNLEQSIREAYELWSQDEPLDWEFAYQDLLDKIQPYKEEIFNKLKYDVEFGFQTTDDPYVTGYVLPDGSGLDFSLGTGQRVREHREVSPILNEFSQIPEHSFGDDHKNKMLLVALGAFQWMPEANIAMMIQKPTRAQIGWLKNFIMNYGKLSIAYRDGELIEVKSLREAESLLAKIWG